MMSLSLDKWLMRWTRIEFKEPYNVKLVVLIVVRDLPVDLIWLFDAL